MTRNHNEPPNVARINLLEIKKLFPSFYGAFVEYCDDLLEPGWQIKKPEIEKNQMFVMWLGGMTFASGLFIGAKEHYDKKERKEVLALYRKRLEKLIDHVDDCLDESAEVKPESDADLSKALSSKFGVNIEVGNFAGSGLSSASIIEKVLSKDISKMTAPEIVREVRDAIHATLEDRKKKKAHDEFLKNLENIRTKFSGKNLFDMPAFFGIDLGIPRDNGPRPNVNDK
jgi:hypothetical protein